MYKCVLLCKSTWCLSSFALLFTPQINIWNEVIPLCTHTVTFTFIMLQIQVCTMKVCTHHSLLSAVWNYINKLNLFKTIPLWGLLSTALISMYSAFIFSSNGLELSFKNFMIFWDFKSLYLISSLRTLHHLHFCNIHISPFIVSSVFDCVCLKLVVKGYIEMMHGVWLHD